MYLKGQVCILTPTLMFLHYTVKIKATFNLLCEHVDPVNPALQRQVWPL